MGGIAWRFGQFIGADTPVIREVFQGVKPSVVSIRARSRDVMPGTHMCFTGVGSGVLISGDGEVLTAAHLVHAMDDIYVRFSTGETVLARVKASSSMAPDLALLQLDWVPPDAAVSPLADSRTVRAGDPAFIVGASYRVRHALTVGSIKAQRSPARLSMPLIEFFQGDTVTDDNSSGAPMFNLQGEVIAMVSRNIWSGHARRLSDFVVTLNTAGLWLLEEHASISLTGRPVRTLQLGA